jgi:hypothetical protein
MSRQMFADIPSLISPAAGTGFPGRSGAGVRCEATRKEVFDGGSTARRARRAVSRLAQDTYRRDPGLTIAGRSGGSRFTRLRAAVAPRADGGFSTRMVEDGR